MRPLNVRSNYTTPKVHIWAVLFLFFFSLLLFYFILFFHFSKSNRYRGHALKDSISLILYHFVCNSIFVNFSSFCDTLDPQRFRSSYWTPCMSLYKSLGVSNGIKDKIRLKRLKAELRDVNKRIFNTFVLIYLTKKTLNLVTKIITLK